MNFRFTAFTPLPLLLSLTCAAQVPNIAPPPIKMGLWQSSVTLNSTGMGPLGGRAITNQSCYTPDSWKQSMQRMQSHQQDMNCSTSNFEQDSHKMSFDGQCSSNQGYNVTYHIEMFLDSDEAMHGTSSAKMAGPSFPQGMTMTSNISSKFISSDCGDIKPGQSRPVHP